MQYCKICGSTTNTIKDIKNSILYYHCDCCQFISKSPDNYIEFHEERSIYNYHNNSIEDEKYVDMFRSFIDKSVTPYVRSGKLLDFGSGPEPVLVQLLNREYNFDTEYYDLHYSPEKVYINKKYDVIVSTEVIEHIKNPIETFKLIYELLEVGGVFAFMTIHHYNDYERFLKWWYRRDKTHISFYNDVTLEKIADILGFEILYTDSKRICTFKKM